MSSFYLCRIKCLTYYTLTYIINIESNTGNGGLKMLYFAYGSNLDYDRMRGRCPSADYICNTKLYGFKLVFMANNSGKIVANILRTEDNTDYVEGVVYKIHYTEWFALDRAEGCPYVYDKHEVEVKMGKHNMDVWVYMMEEFYSEFTYANYSGAVTLNKPKLRKRAYGMPTDNYLKFLLKGYDAYKLSNKRLQKALNYSVQKGAK